MENHSSNIYCVLIKLPKLSLWILVSAHIASDPRVGIFSFIIVKRCPIAAKIAGSIGILPCYMYVLNDFFHTGMNLCPICEATLGNHTLCMGNLVWFQWSA